MPARNCQNVQTLVRINAPTTADAANDVRRRNTLHTLPTQCLAVATSQLSIIYIRVINGLSMTSRRRVGADPGIVGGLAMLIRGLSAACWCSSMLYH